MPARHSNVDIGNVGAMNQQELHDCIKGWFPYSSGNMHIKSSPFWDIGQAVKFTESLGYKGLYSIEVSRHEARPHRLQHDPGEPCLVSRPRSPVTFGRRCIPGRGVARRLHTPGMRPPRALRAGRIAALGVNRTSGTQH